MTLKTTLAAPFYHSRAGKLGRGELMYYYSFDRRWMDKDKVDLLLTRGLDQGLIGTDGEFFYPLFDLADVQIPMGYKPSSAILEVADPVEQLMDRIATQGGQTQEMVASAMNALVRDRFDGTIRPEAALVILARQHNVVVGDLIPAIRAGFYKKD
ncbi:MAG TPA: DUF2240 family protein [Methanospirillum sp.]|nr:DUF2240 family protein [Methanospirillum sp.]